MKRSTYLVFFAVSALVLSSCSPHLGLSKIFGGGSQTGSSPAASSAKPATTSSGGGTTISISNGKYRPKNLTVKVGTTLTWTNKDSTSQSVTSDTPGIFDSGALAPGAMFSYTFSTAGVFPYHSTATSTTFGSITVTP